MGAYISPQISVGDLILVAGLLANVIYNWAFINNTLVMLKKEIDDLKRGRNLIMGDDSSWPLSVRRCFGMVEKRHPHDR